MDNYAKPTPISLPLSQTAAKIRLQTRSPTPNTFFGGVSISFIYNHLLPPLFNSNQISSIAMSIAIQFRANKTTNFQPHLIIQYPNKYIPE